MLTEKQRAALTAAAKAKGVDPDELIKEAEAVSGSKDDTKGEAPSTAKSAEPKPLYQYHLPFLTVNEVRMVWLGLDAMPGGDVNAAKYAAAQTAGSSPATVKPDPEPA